MTERDEPEPTMEQRRELHNALTELANSTKAGSIEKLYRIDEVRECSQCNEVVIPEVVHIGTSADWAYYDVTWNSKCGQSGTIEITYDWGEEGPINNHKAGNPDNFRAPKFSERQKAFEIVTGTKLPSLANQ